MATNASWSLGKAWVEGPWVLQVLLLTKGSAGPERKERLVDFSFQRNSAKLTELHRQGATDNVGINTEIRSLTNAFCRPVGMASSQECCSSSSEQSTQFIFNHKTWLSEFNTPKNVKRLRVEIMGQALEACKNFKYTLEDGSQVTFADHESVSKDARKTTLHIEEVPPERITGEESFETKIVVVNADCLVEAIRLRNEGFNPAVLNMASPRRPGKSEAQPVAVAVTDLDSSYIIAV